MAGNPNATGVFAPNPHPLAGADSVPTEPTPPPEIPPNHPASRQKEPPDSFADRFVGLSKVHGWMPPQTVATLAGLPQSDAVVGQMAADLRKAYGTVDNSVHYLTEDPLLQKQPSLGLAIRSYLTNTIGPWPLEDSDLVHVQKQLVKMGYGAGLPTDGVWNNGWNGAYSQYVENAKQLALGGDQTGSTPVGTALGFLNDLLPRQAATAVAAYVKALPSGLRDDVNTLAGSIGGTFNNVTKQPQVFLRNPLHQLHGHEADVENQGSAKVENAVPGTHVTPQTTLTAQGNRTVAMDSAILAGDLFATHGLFRAGGVVAAAAGDNGIRTLDAAAAQRGPGVIAKTLYKSPTQAEGGATGVLSTKAFANTPILRLAGPVADRISGSEGAYYRARTLLASPYKWGPTRTVGTAVGQLGVAGGKIRAIGTAESLIGGQTSPLSANIDHMQTINQFDDALQTKLGFTVLGHHFSPGINTLAWLLHPPLDGPGTVSASIGSDVTQANEAIKAAYGGDQTGFGLAIERGVNMAGRRGEDYQTHSDLVDAAGGESNFTQFWLSKVYQHAAVHYAEKTWGEMSQADQADMLDKFKDQAAAIHQLAKEAFQRSVNGDPTDLTRAAAEMVTNDNQVKGTWGGPNELAKRIASEIVRSSDSPRAWVRKNIQNYAEASRLMREVVVPRRAEQIADQVPSGTIGMARTDYLTSEQAATEAQELDDQYQETLQRLHAGGEDSAKAAQDIQKVESQIAGYLFDHYGIDADHMPARVSSDDPKEMTLLKLLHQKAEGQSTRMFLRDRPVRTMPGDVKPTLNRSGPTQGAMLDNHTEGPVFTNLGAKDAMDLVHDRDQGSGRTAYKWTNARDMLRGSKSVIVEHEPGSVYGTRDDQLPGARYQQQFRNRANFQGSRNGVDDFEGIKSVEIRPQRGETQAENGARRILANQLKDNGYLPFDQGSGAVRWVRNDLTGGTIAASPDLRAAYARLEELGYMPVMTDGLGFDFYEHPTLDVFDSHLGTARRIVEKLGISPENVPSADLGFDFNLKFHRQLQDAIEDGKIKLPPYWNAQTIMAELRDKDLLHSKPGIASFVMHKVPPTSSYKAAEDALTESFFRKGDPKTGEALTENDARKLASQRLSDDVEKSLGLMHVTPGDIKSVLGRRANENVPKETQLARELEFRHYNPDKHGAGVQPLSKIYKEQPLMDDDSIQEVYRAIQRAKLDMPTRLVGLQKVETLAQQGMSYMGRAVPGTYAENLPSRLLTLRNKFRFQLSPEFSARRVVKAMVKVSADGVPPTFFPKVALDKMGVEKRAMKLLDRIMPELKNDSYDEGTQALYATDPWGMFNHRYHEAYATWHWKQMGKTDTEIRALITKDFGYGSAAYGEGRSALERSINFTFFPFSFDKTLYRNLGAYMLDHTAQRMALTAGLQAYNNYNKSDPDGSKLASSGWFNKHMPVAQEALRLNAFAHGVGLGQFGGINAPILNMFIPQQYNADSGAVQTIKGFIPAARELQELTQEFSQQGQIAKQLTIDQLHPVKPGIFFARPVAETPTAQLTDAYIYRRQLNSWASTQIEYNAHHTDKYTLGSDPKQFGQYAGAVINATLIDQLVHQKYPAFQIEDPSVYYAQAAAKITNYSQEMKASGHTQVVDWIGAAQKLGENIYRGKDPQGLAAANTKIIRNAAVSYAETIPGFLTFYNSNFRWQYGPLEAVR